LIPLLEVGLNQSPQEHSQCSIGDLNLAIHLWVVSGIIFEFSTQLLLQSHPKVTSKLNALIQHYRPWNAIELHHFFEVQIGYMGGIISLVALYAFSMHLNEANTKPHEDGIILWPCLSQ